jgi:hypothetical protein
MQYFKEVGVIPECFALKTKRTVLIIVPGSMSG